MRITNEELLKIVKEETDAVLLRRRMQEQDEDEREEDQEGSKDEQEAAKEQGMKSDVIRVAKFMFKNKQLGPALEKIKGNVEAAQLLGLLAQELGVQPGDISNVMAKVKKGMSDKEDAEQEEVKEGRYKRSPYRGEDPRAQAFDQAIQLLDDQVYDSLEDDVASYADEAVRALSKAIDELEYKRNQVGNINEKRK